MAGDIARISEALGRLNAQSDIADQRHAEIIASLDSMQKTMVCLPLVKDRLEQVNRRLDKVELIADDYVGKKNRFLGAMGLIGLFGGGMAWVLHKLWP